MKINKLFLKPNLTYFVVSSYVYNLRSSGVKHSRLSFNLSPGERDRKITDSINVHCTT